MLTRGGKVFEGIRLLVLLGHMSQHEAFCGGGLRDDPVSRVNEPSQAFVLLDQDERRIAVQQDEEQRMTQPSK